MLVAQGLCKSFASVPAIIDVDLMIAPGQIHALLGENGAGKSTLMNLIAGLYRPDAGSITLDERPLHLRSPADALEAGIGMVHQHFKLIPSMTVSENFATFAPGLCYRPRDWRVRLSQLSDKFSLPLDPERRVCDLSMGERQRVEILRLLARQARILILDEPTAVLTPQESDALFVALRRLVQQQRSVLIVTHKLREVFQTSDAITVLRHGQVVMTSATAAMNEQRVALAMIGEHIATTTTVSQPRQEPHSSSRLTVVGLNGQSLRGLDLTLTSGTITAIVGVSGNGQDELFQVLLGTIMIPRGVLQLGDQDLAGIPLRSRQNLGMAFIHPDVRQDAILPEMTAAENLILDRISRRPKLNSKRLMGYAASLCDRYRIVTPDLATPAAALSGGNMQKIAIARELSRNPHVVVAMNPTRGLDIVATASIHSEMRLLAHHGAAVLVMTEDLDEAYTLAHKLHVMSRGHITLSRSIHEATREAVGLAMGAAAT